MCTGLEPILLGMGASAGVASIGASALGGLGASMLAKQFMPKPPSAPPIAPATPPPQASAAPDRQAGGMLPGGAMMGGPMNGNQSTFLTGSTGVDQKSLKLGNNTLLGS
jgi:hypothetical protein